MRRPQIDIEDSQRFLRGRGHQFVDFFLSGRGALRQTAETDRIRIANQREERLVRTDLIPGDMFMNCVLRMAAARELHRYSAGRHSWHISQTRCR